MTKQTLGTELVYDNHKVTEAGHKMAARTGETATDKALAMQVWEPELRFPGRHERGGGDKEDPHGLPAGQLSWVSEFRVQWETLSWMIEEDRHLWDTHMPSRPHTGTHRGQLTGLMWLLYFPIFTGSFQPVWDV